MDYIEHYGVGKLEGASVGSGRYPLGSGDRPYQDYPNLRKKFVDKYKEFKEKREAKRKEKYEKEDEKRRKEIDKENEKFENQKKKHEKERNIALRRGSAQDILRYQGEYTNDELSKALQRLRYEKDLRSYLPKKRKAIDVFDDIMTIADKTRKWTENGIKSYNLMANLMNSKNATEIIAGNKSAIQTIDTKWYDNYIKQNKNKNKDKQDDN